MITKQMLEEKAKGLAEVISDPRHDRGALTIEREIINAFRADVVKNTEETQILQDRAKVAEADHRDAVKALETANKQLEILSRTIKAIRGQVDSDEVKRVG